MPQEKGEQPGERPAGGRGLGALEEFGAREAGSVVWTQVQEVKARDAGLGDAHGGAGPQSGRGPGSQRIQFTPQPHTQARNPHLSAHEICSGC